MRLPSYSAAICCAAVVIAMAGCGTELPTVAPVHGHVYLDGKPVPLGRIDFVPTSGPAATARIQPDGTYRLSTLDDGDGAVVGSHVVTIRAVKVPDDSASTDIMVSSNSSRASVSESTIKWYAPQRYSRRNTTPLTAIVIDGENVLDFHLSVD